jgi:hypothetical protein
MARGDGTKLTARQKKAIELFKAQILTGTFKPIEDTLLEAEYSPETARQLANTMNALRPHLESTIAWMEDHRARIQEQMAAKVGSAQYADLVRALDVTTRNIQLLGGKPTANIQLSAEDRARLDNLIEP